MINEYKLQPLMDQLLKKSQCYLQEQSIEDPIMVGIHTTGVWLARQLHAQLAIQEPLGEINIGFYRDDFQRNGYPKQSSPTRLPPSIDDRHILIVDDVLHTGRTIRAAMNELFDYGRPASISLIVLVSRSGRDLPIEAQVHALKLDLDEQYHFHIQSEESEYLRVIPNASNVIESVR